MPSAGVSLPSAIAPCVALPPASLQSSAIAPALLYLLHPCSRAPALGKSHERTAGHGLKDAERRQATGSSSQGWLDEATRNRMFRWSRPTKRGEAREARRAIRQAWPAVRSWGFPEVEQTHCTVRIGFVFDVLGSFTRILAGSFPRIPALHDLSTSLFQSSSEAAYCSALISPSSSLTSAALRRNNQPSPKASVLTRPGSSSSASLTAATSPDTGA